MEQTLRTLPGHPDFLEGRDWNLVAYRAASYVFRESDVADSLYLVQSGTVRIIADLELDEGRHIHPGVCDLSAGEVYPARSASVMAVTDCELIRFDCAGLLAFLDRHPDIGYAVLQKLINICKARLELDGCHWTTRHNLLQ